jgi:hypothetical protein
MDLVGIFPVRRIGEKRLERAPIEGVSRAVAVEMPDQRAAGEGKIADSIEQLVPNALVGITKPAIVENAIGGDDDSVVERTAEGEAGGLQGRSRSRR